MTKVAAVKNIIDQLNLVEYMEDSARYVKVGPFRIEQNGDQTWELVGPNTSIWLSTRMGAMGYAKCLISESPWMADKILNLDHAVGLSHTHWQSISNAMSSNSSLGAKQQQAEERYRESMRQLQQAVLSIL